MTSKSQNIKLKDAINVNKMVIINPSMVEKLIDKKIQNMQSGENVFGVGRVTKVKDFIIEVVGISGAHFYEKVNIANKAIGYVTKLETNHSIIAVVSETEKICVGDVVYQTNEEFMGEFSEEAMGRVVDIFGRDKLNNKKFQQTIKIS